MFEEWRDVCGFEGIYQVSSLGRVRNVKFIGHKRSTKQDRILKPALKRDGYLQVHLSKGNKDFHIAVHRLVATAFLENPHGLSDVNHKDENKLNNHVENLEWCTKQYNTAYGTGQKRAHEAKKRSILQLQKENGVVVREYPGVIDASIDLFGSPKKAGAIAKCARGEMPTAYGFKWKYKVKETDAG